MQLNKLFQGNALEILKNFPSDFVDCVITSPPYYMLRDYGQETVFIWDGDANCEHEWEQNFCKKCNAWIGQLGHEPSPDLYVKHLADVFDQVYKVLKKDGNIFVVIGDSYASGGVKKSFGKLDYVENISFYGYAKQNLLKSNKGTWIKEKQLLLIPYRFAIELQNRGWIVRDLIIWGKKIYSINYGHQFGNGLPEPVKDRLTKSYEVIIHAVKSSKYYFNKPKARSSEVNLEASFCDNKSFKWEKLSRKSKFYDAKSINVGSSLGGRLVKNFLIGKEYTFVRKALIDVNVYLKKKLKESGLSLDELAKITGIKKTTLEHYFRTDPSGATLPSKEAWQLMKKVLGLCEYEECIKEEYKSVLPVVDAFAYVGNVIHCNTEPTKEKHYAVMPSKLVEFLIRIGCKEGGVVLDPFGGIGTVAMVAESLNRNWILIEANSQYLEIARKRLKGIQKRLF